MTKLLAFVVAAVLGCSPAFAGSATVNYNSTGASAFRTTTDGSANNIAQHTIWDSVAGANGLAVTANNAVKAEGVGTAGSAAGGILTVQGVASMTPMLVNPGNASNFGVQTQGSTTSGESGSLTMGAVTTAAPTYTTAQTNPLSLDTAGNLRINCTTGCSSSGGSSLADEGVFTQGTTSFTVAGGIFNNSITNLTTGQAGAVRLTNDRKMLVDMPNVEVSGITTGVAAAASAAQIAGVFQTSPPTLTTGQAVALQMTAAGSVHTTVDNSNANGSATMANASPVVIASDQTGSCTGRIAVNQTASTDLITSVAKLNICAIVLVSATAQNISLVEGTGTTCATGTAALIGGSTASVAVAANGGFSSIAGIPWLKTQTTADHLCLLQSGAGNVSGVITYLDHS